MPKGRPGRRSTVDLLTAGARALAAATPTEGATNEPLFGTPQQEELNRLAEMIDDVHRQLENQHAPGMGSEELAILFAALAPGIARATASSKRDRFRDLLTNASRLEPGNPDWDSARTVGKWIDSLEPPAFEILAYINEHTHGLDFGPDLHDILKGIEQHEAVVMKERLNQLVHDGLLRQAEPTEGPPRRVYALSTQGQFMIRWTTSDRISDASEG